MKPPILYYGAKGTTAARIVSMMPAHVGYVEPFCGSLAVLLEKPVSKIEVVNDLDREVMTFWRVLRERPEDLIRVAMLTPHSRAELVDANLREDLDELELARRVWVRLTQGRSGTLRKTGWRFFLDGTKRSSSLATYRDRLGPAAERLLDVALECRPALDVIRDYGTAASNLLYVDPPYLGTTRSGRNYAHDMTAEDEHRELADALNACKSMVMLSGYASDLYEDLYADWNRVEFPALTGNGLDMARTEVLWSNCDLAGQQPMFDLEGMTA